MRKGISIFLAISLLVLAFAATSFADEGMSPHCHWDSGQAFGQHHAEMAQAGMLGAGHNPGTHHQGYSICVPR